MLSPAQLSLDVEAHTVRGDIVALGVAGGRRARSRTSSRCRPLGDNGADSTAARDGAERASAGHVRRSRARRWPTTETVGWSSC